MSITSNDKINLKRDKITIKLTNKFSKQQSDR